MTLGTLERRIMARLPKPERWCPRCDREAVAVGRRVCGPCSAAERRLNEYWQRWRQEQAA